MMGVEMKSDSSCSHSNPQRWHEQTCGSVKIMRMIDYRGKGDNLINKWTIKETNKQIQSKLIIINMNMNI